MKRIAGLLLTLSGMCGCVSGPDFHHAHQAQAGCCAEKGEPPENPIGPWGQPVYGAPKSKPKPGLLTAPADNAKGPPGQPPGQPPGTPPPSMRPPVSQRTQVSFAGPIRAKLGWYTAGPDGRPIMSANQLELPNRFNFPQAAIYRMRLSEIPSRPGLVLYPSLEVVPANAKTDAYLSHNHVPVEFTEEDFDQVTTGNFVTKVVYLPDAQFRNLGTAGPEELISTRLEPGMDPVTEAYRRGHILIIVRLGGIDLDMANSPPLYNHGPYAIPRGDLEVGDSHQPAKPPARQMKPEALPRPSERIIHAAPAQQVQQAKFEEPSESSAPVISTLPVQNSKVEEPSAIDAEKQEPPVPMATVETPVLRPMRSGASGGPTKSFWKFGGGKYGLLNRRQSPETMIPVGPYPAQP